MLIVFYAKDLYQLVIQNYYLWMEKRRSEFAVGVIMLNFPDKKYNIIYVDPAWEYDLTGVDSCTNGKYLRGTAKQHYDTMSMKELLDLPIQKISDKNCHLYLWYTNSFVREAHQLCEKWGFNYKQTLTWVKTYPNGKIITGAGFYFRGCTEHLIFATKGKLPRGDKTLKNLVISSRGEHSKKPNIFRDLIVKQSGDLPRIELFARTKIHGWDVWGDDPKLQNKPMEAFSHQLINKELLVD